MAKLTLILGGARSGKSSFAVELARKYNDVPVIYVATAQALDDEMRDRIEQHKRLRPASWQVIESPKDVAKIITGLSAGLILIDCLTLYVTNMLLDDNKKDVKEDYITEEIERLCTVSQNSTADVIMVSNEVGHGIVPADPVSRSFRDIAGKTNQIVASRADEVYLITAGISQRLK